MKYLVTFTARWDGSRVYGELNYTWWPEHMLDVVEISMPPSGKLLEADRYANAYIADASLAVERIAMPFNDAFPGEHTSSFSAIRIVSGDETQKATLHRYLFRGIRFHGWGDSTQRLTVSDGTFSMSRKRDSYDTTFFGRRARITQLVDDESNQHNQVIAVTLAGAALDEHEEHILWLVISFVAGSRAQTIVNEHFDNSGAILATEYLGSGEYGASASRPPFDLRIAFTAFDPATFDVLATGFSRLIRDRFPLAVALHHLHDANTSYTQVEMKNLLFCIHTIFESWSDVNQQREILKKSHHDKLRRKLDPDLERIFGADTEIRQSVRDAIRSAFNRTGAVLQEKFFESQARVLTDGDIRALRRRNSLFHNGYLVAKNGQSQDEFLQELIDDSASLRALAHEAILKLAGYRGMFFDYTTWHDRVCELPGNIPETA